MAEDKTILKNPKLGPDEDYAFLRSEGLKYIEELGSALWTDYNEHDPGITILEALCYAITELGYRAGLPVKDLLTGKDGKIAASQALFPAKKILTQAPLTVNDYRKLLADIDGVHNAWLFTDDVYTHKSQVTPAGEVALYADCTHDALSYTVTPHPVFLSGLYKVLLDLDDHPQFGDLNNGTLNVLSPATDSLKAGAVSLGIIFPAWNKADSNLLKADHATLVADDVPVILQDGTSWKMTAHFSVTAGGITINTAVEGKIVVDLQPPGKTIATTDIQNFFTKAFTKQVLELYILKIRTSWNIVQTVVKTLQENRNLCEDFASVDTILDEEIAFCCNIDISPDTDMEEVQAKVFYAIEEYLHPSVRFYLLKELIDKGLTTDEIFEGPLLRHGFIDTAKLEQTQLRTTIYASDIISLIMDIKGVLAARNFRMTKYGSDGKPVAAEKGKSWCMTVSSWHKPLLSDTKSKILFFKSAFPYLPGQAEVRDTLRWLRATNARNKLTGHTDDLPIPSGNYYDLGAYTSIQYLFPQTYGVGKARLPASATQERKATANQLKAYLLLYDQLLADFFSQLNNTKDLFSTADIVQTYYGQYLGNSKEMEPVYKKNGSAAPLLKTLLQTQNSTLAGPGEWQKLYEPNKTFIERRNRFLDHLMARFAESFNEYVLLMYSLDYETQQEKKIDPADLIRNKIEFLQSYPDVSYTRAKAFNYYPLKPDDLSPGFIIDTDSLWDTGNVSGLEQKAGRLAGIKKIQRRFLYCFSQADIIPTADTPARYRFIFQHEEGHTLTSYAAYPTQHDAAEALTYFAAYAKAADHYAIEASGTHQQVVIKDNAGNPQAVSNDFADARAAANAKNKFIADFNAACDPEGLHLIEHILLRPRNKAFELPPVCLDPNCDFCGEQDPYSFRISVVLPYWPGRFYNVAFRDYFENMIRREAPAHTTVKVCWLTKSAMLNFETAYKKWIAALAGYAADAAAVNTLQAANDTLTDILFHLHSEYPVATLHDCEDSKDTNPVMLGRTILGSYKNNYHGKSN